MPKRKKRSVVWDHFGLPTADEKPTVQCLICNVKLSYCKTTGNLLNHLKSTHPTLDLSSSSEDNVLNGGTGQQSIGSYYSMQTMTKKRQEKVTDLLVNFVVGDVRPMGIVSGAHFQKFMKYVAPGYPLPDRVTLTRRVDEKYEVSKGELKTILEGPQKMALTFDGWTSRRQESYLGVTVHFWPSPTNDCNSLEDYTLACMPVNDNQTAQNIVSWILDILEDFGIAVSQVMTVVTDNGSNIVAAMRELSARFGWVHIRCAAHSLQLCVKDAIAEPSTSKALKSARHLVSHFKHSPKATRELKKFYKSARVDGMPAQLELVSDTPTRWNSTCDMIERLCTHQWVVRQYLENTTESIKDDHWIILGKLVKMLKPMKVATDVLQGSKYATVSSVIPMIKGLIISYGNENATDAYERRFNSVMLSSLQSRFSVALEEGPNFFKKATFLDPRYRGDYFASEELAQVKESLDLDLHASNYVPAPITADLPTTENEETRLLSMARVANNDVVENTTENQLAWFTQQRINSANPIMWWNENGHNAPGLQALAKSILSTPASSAPSERSFSAAGLIVSKVRSRLTGSHVNNLVFLHCNDQLI